MPDEVTLNTCDREPIHIPGSIQSHGCLLACDLSADRVLRASDNAPDTLGLAKGESLSAMFEPHVAHDLRNAFALSTEPKRPGLLLDYQLTSVGPAFDVAAHRYEDHAILEFEKSAPGRKTPLELARAMIARTQKLSSIDLIARNVPRFLQAMLEYDRVMLYRFSEDGAGKVIGEAKRPALESFLGQHFPAADIPVQARALYLKNTIRVIADTSGARSLIVPEYDADGAPLDLSYAHLRSVSPIHLEYLRNMGVAASMSLSIVVGDKLWGLIACHHYGPRVLSMPQRIAAEIFGDFLSLHVAATYHQTRYDASLRARQRLDAMMSALTFHDHVGDFLRERLPEFRQLIPCDGVGLWLNGVWTSEGSTPPLASMPMLVSVLKSRPDPGVWATQGLSERIPAATEFAPAASGLLAVPLSKLPRDFLLYFRKEQVQTLEWAGDPNKSYKSGPFGDRLTPRSSFAIWKQLVERQSSAWSEEDHHTAEAARISLQEVILRQSEIVEAERKEAEVRQRILNEELNHRVKNILALIKSLVSHKGDVRQSIEDYAGAVKGRIMALAFAHDQVVRSDGGGSLRQLFEAELSPYPAAQIALTGDDQGLDARAYSVMALVVHELATNAAKYGALSIPAGRLAASFRLVDGDCEIIWSESSGPPVAPPSRSGFGSVLLNRSIPFDLGGSTAIDYPETGVHARLTLPAKHILAVAAKPRSPARAGLAAKPAGGIEGLKVLLVEDQLVIALDAEDMLRELGAETIETAASVGDALKLLRASPPDFAVLDVNLGAGTSVAVAEELRKRTVPFLFATGYGDTSFIPNGMKDIPVVRKPFSLDSLREGLARILGVAAPAD